MKLTSFTDYSLRVLIFLAAQPGRRATIAEIATAFDVKENHLTKVVHFLGQVGLLTNVRGKGGGLDLARAPKDIVIGDVVRETEGSKGGGSPGVGLTYSSTVSDAPKSNRSTSSAGCPGARAWVVFSQSGPGDGAQVEFRAKPIAVR